VSSSASPVNGHQFLAVTTADGFVRNCRPWTGAGRYLERMPQGDSDRRARFLDLHRPGAPLLMPNAYDAGSARILAALGFTALATTSSGFAATLGREDYDVTRDDAVAHGGAIAAAVDVPVSADTENGFSDEPEGVADMIREVAATDLAGCSIEDFTGRPDDPVYPRGQAAERIAAAVEAAAAAARHGGGSSDQPLVITARAENYLHDRPDLDDTIARLQAFQEAGADVLYAPGITAPDDKRAVVTSVDRPVNILALPACPPVAELAAAGVARISVGGAFLYAAYAGLIEAATELRDSGSYGYWDAVAAHRTTIRGALTSTGNS
jgi:2-methylisocitrate lyase-like PEP mutase family enzyme